MNNATKKVLNQSSQAGLTYLNDASRITKFVWLALLVVFTILTVFQISKQVQQFLDKPINTDIEVEYHTHLKFPVVVLCNSNKLRLTHHARDLPALVQEFNSKETTVESMLDLYNKKIEGESARKVYRAAAHKIENMILRCKFGGVECGAKNFTPIMTDYGLCYGFNINIDSTLNSTTVGANAGLSLLINMESYEKIQENQCTVDFVQRQGLLIGIFDQNQVPVLSSHSINLPLGYGTDVGIKILKRERLVNCIKEAEQQPVHIYNSSFTSYQACLQDKKFNSIIKFCRCVPFNIPNNAQANSYIKKLGYPYCTMKQQRNCASVKEHELAVHPPPGNCKERCETIEFQTQHTVSELPDRIVPSTLSEKDEKLNKRRRIFRRCQPSILTLEEWTKIIDQYADAIEAKYRFYNEFWTPVDTMLKNLKLANDRLTELEWLPLSEFYKPTYDRLLGNVTCMTSMFEDHKEIVERMNLQKALIPKSEILQLAGILVPEESDIDTIDKLYEENSENVTYMETLTDMVEKELHDSWYPYNQMNYRSTLSENLTSYDNVLEFIDRYFNANITLKFWANAMIGDEMNNFWTNKYPEVFIESIKSELKELQHSIAELHNNDPLYTIVNNRTQLQLATLLKLKLTDDEALQKMEEFLRNLRNCTFGEMRDFGKFLTDTFLNTTADFVESYEDIVDFHRSYLESFSNKEQFLKGNVISVNIYFTSLSTQTLSQEWAYTAWSMLCDIGGTLGLFVGASIIGLFEIIWLAVIGYLESRQNKETYGQNGVDTNQNNIFNYSEHTKL